ncbi:MAG: cupin domain-containing protein [Armatimonadota bacterium]|nr:cupin domain-containing protein [Armatimonadota bacterium]
MRASGRDVRVVDGSGVAPLSFEWGTLRWLFNKETDPHAQQTFGLCRIEPGEANPRHFHPNCEEILYVLCGECDHTFGTQVVRLKPGMMIRIPSGVPHNARCVSAEPLEAVISFSSPDRQTVGEDSAG